MRINVWKTVLAACCVLAIAGLNRTNAAGELAQEEQIATAPPGPDGPMMGKGRFELTPEQVDHILAEIKEKNPQEANELTTLRAKDPNAFRMELRNHMREQFMSHMMEQRGEQGKSFENAQGRRQPQQGQMPMMQGPGADFMREKIQEKTDEYLKCLKENYPDEAAKLEQLRKDNPDQFARAMMISGKKYGPICMAIKDDPNLAKVLKQQLELKTKRAELLKQIRATTDEKQKKALTGELEQIIGQQFDLIVKRKEMAYEDLTKKLADLQKEVGQRKAEVEKWKGKDFKSQKVKERVTELLNEKEKFEWDN
ncbi:MAG: hypothetical protein ABSG97_10490 [Sedimentisphaerales bacterium]|jgi:hypothetical protein